MFLTQSHKLISFAPRAPSSAHAAGLGRAVCDALPCQPLGGCGSVCIGVWLNSDQSEWVTHCWGPVYIKPASSGCSGSFVSVVEGPCFVFRGCVPNDIKVEVSTHVFVCISADPLYTNNAYSGCMCWRALRMCASRIACVRHLGGRWTPCQRKTQQSFDSHAPVSATPTHCHVVGQRRGCQVCICAPVCWRLDCRSAPLGVRCIPLTVYGGMCACSTSTCM